MQNEIVLPAGRQFLLTAEIPRLIAQALYPDDLDEASAMVTALRKRPKVGTPQPGFPEDVLFALPSQLTDDDWKRLHAVWANLQALVLPISEADWQPYILAFEQRSQDLDWTLDPTTEEPWATNLWRRHIIEKEHAQALERSIESGELEQLSLHGQIPTTRYYENGKVTVEALTRYVAQFQVKVRLEKATNQSEADQPARAAPAMMEGSESDDEAQNADAKYSWVPRVRAFAVRIYEDAAAKGWGTDQESIAKEVEKKCADENLLSHKRKPLTAAYIRRHALTPWNVPQTVQAKRQNK